jgi:hypothetical protein
MNTIGAVCYVDRQQLVWRTCFASLFKFQTRCDSARARLAADRAFEQFGAVPPFSAVESVIRGELTWPTTPEGD